MRFLNATPYSTGWTTGFERDGRELLIVIVKATYIMPTDSSDPVLASEQLGLVECDVWNGDPGYSSTVYETDYAHRKPFCDVLLNGSAYAPHGRPVTEVGVALRVGTMKKVFLVKGNRHWRQGLVNANPSAPEPFTSIPISYDNAFGGFDDSDSDLIRVFHANPAGRGFSYHKKKLDGQPLPNTEVIGSPVRFPDSNYKPMSFGALGRHWQPRCSFVGTYDKAWIENHAPFWPDDFDYRYFQAAPPDQQLPYLTGGEDVVLAGLHPSGDIHFKLPLVRMPVIFIPYRGADHNAEGVLDTVLIEPDHQRFTMTWRASMAQARSFFDIDEIVIGEMSRGWHRARSFPGKPYYKSLAEMVKARRK